MKSRYLVIGVGGGLGGAAALSLVWRYASRRHTLPCPSWLPWLLENPYMNAVAAADTILDGIAISPGMKLLDAGCGIGRLTIPASKRVGASGEVVALDPQSGMLRQVAQKMNQSPFPNIHLVQAGIGDGTLESDHFDRALLVTVLGEITNREAAFAEIFRALKPGGILSITEALPDPHYQTKKTVRLLAHQAGFEELATSGNAVAFTMLLMKPLRKEDKIKLPELTAVSSTLFAPLYMKRAECWRPDAILSDKKAVELATQIDYDFGQLKPAAAVTQTFAMLRTREIDAQVRAFLIDHPNGTVVDMGCGLDTRFYRVDNGTVNWFDLDLPEVIDLRWQVLPEPPRGNFIARSLMEFGWMDALESNPDKPILFVAEGVLPYFKADEVRALIPALCKRFPGSEIVFDALPPEFVRLSGIHPVLRATHAELKWGLNDAREIEQWQPTIHLIKEWHYFDQPEPRLRWFKLFKQMPMFSKTCVLHYRFDK